MDELNPGAPEGAAATVEPTPSVEDTMGAVFDKLNPPRDPGGQFIQKDKPAETLEAPAEQITDQPNETEGKPAEEPAISPPASWSADKKTVFASLPRDAQEYILARETEAQTALSQLGRKAKAAEEYDRIVGPRRQALVAEAGSVEAGINRLFALSDMAASNPQGFLQWFAQQRGIDRRALMGSQEPVDANSELAATKRELADIKAYLRNQSLTQTETQQRSTASLVEKFAADPANKHFADLESDIELLIPVIRQQNPDKSPADVLKLAYDKACRANDTVWSKIEAERREADDKKRKEEAEKKAAEAKKLQAINVKANQGGNPAAPKTMEESMAAVYDRLHARG
jgi:hypothetical protein